MKRKLLFLLSPLMAFFHVANAQLNDRVEAPIAMQQPQPFLFTINTLNPSARAWSLNYSGGYGQNTTTPLGYNGVDQNLAIKGYLGAKFTLFANLGVGFAKAGGSVNTFQQAEVFRDFVGGDKPDGFRVGLSLGFRREFNNDKVALSRITAAYESLGWRLGGNVRFEKAFAEGRDGVDIISSIGIHRQVSGSFFAGFEAVGQDLEGFWESEAEGGAKLLVGPSLNFVPQSSRFSFTLCGGPIIYATRSILAPNDFAIREIPSSNGFTMKFNVGFRF